jgi:hypothetical protein
MTTHINRQAVFCVVDGIIPPQKKNVYDNLFSIDKQRAGHRDL